MENGHIMRLSPKNIENTNTFNPAKPKKTVCKKNTKTGTWMAGTILLINIHNELGGYLLGKNFLTS